MSDYDYGTAFGNRIVVAAPTRVQALDAQTGETAWGVALQRPASLTGDRDPIVDLRDGAVLVTWNDPDLNQAPVIDVYQTSDGTKLGSVTLPPAASDAPLRYRTRGR